MQPTYLCFARSCHHQRPRLVTQSSPWLSLLPLHQFDKVGAPQLLRLWLQLLKSSGMRCWLMGQDAGSSSRSSFASAGIYLLRTANGGGSRSLRSASSFPPGLGIPRPTEAQSRRHHSAGLLTEMLKQMQITVYCPGAAARISAFFGRRRWLLLCAINFRPQTKNDNSHDP